MSAIFIKFEYDYYYFYNLNKIIVLLILFNQASKFFNLKSNYKNHFF
jgi:hypothetical protein